MFQTPAETPDSRAARAQKDCHEQPAIDIGRPTVDDEGTSEIIQEATPPPRSPSKRNRAVYNSTQCDLISRYFPPPLQKKLITIDEVHRTLDKRPELACIKAKFTAEQIKSKANRMHVDTEKVHN